MVLKKRGNDAFNATNWRDAIAHYTTALAHLTSHPQDTPSEEPDILRILLSNRAVAYIELGNAINGLRDADLALTSYTTATSPKALTAKLHLRRAQAHLVYRHMEEADADYGKYEMLKAHLGEEVRDNPVKRELRRFEALEGRAKEKELERIEVMRACEVRAVLSPL